MQPLRPGIGRSVPLFLLFLLVLARFSTAQQSPQQQQAHDRNAAKEISQDLAQLDALVRDLAPSAEMASAWASHQTWGMTPREGRMMYFKESYDAKAKPSADANKTVTFAAGSKPKLLIGVVTATGPSLLDQTTRLGGLRAM
jgi:hypothetical protein